MQTTVSIEHLLTHSRWLRHLALRLVGDVHAADDLVQATWQAALESGPRHSESVRGWLARVIRRTARAERRGRERRERREHAVAQTGVDASASELVEQADLQRRLVQMVTELSEPGRTTVLLHFFKGLSPAAIARRQGVPASTVRNRLKRALDTIRDRLDQQCSGDRRRWLLALVPLAVDAYAVRAAGRVMAGWGGVAAVGCIAVVAWLVSGFGASEVVPSDADADPLVVVRTVERPPESARSASGTSPSTESERIPAATDAPSFGLVVDDRGAPVAGVELRFQAFGDERSVPLGRSDADGVFELARNLGSGNVDAVGSEWAVALRGRRDRDDLHKLPVVVVAEPAPIRGRVVDPSGHPIGGAVVQLTLPKSLRAAVGVVLDGAEDRDWQVRSEPDGRFAFVDAPAIAGVQAECRAVGFAAWQGATATSMQIELAPFDTDAVRVVRGRVEAADGRAVVGARVSLAGRDTVSGGDGSFELSVVGELPADAKLVAMAAGHGPAVVAASELAVPSVTLRLSSFGSYRGTVRQADGSPIAGVSVRLLPVLSTGASGQGPPQNRVSVTAGRRLRVGPTLRLESATTIEDGSFEIPSPEFERARLLAVHPDTLRTATVDAEGQRDGLDIRFDGAALRSIRGVVVDQWRRPVAGAKVWLRLPMRAANDVPSRIVLASRATTADALGRFRFDGVAAGELEVQASVSGALSDSVRAAALQPAVELAVQRCGHVRVLAQNGADRVRFFDRAGEVLPALAHEGRILRRLRDGVALFEGRSSVVHVPLHAVAVAAYANGKQVAYRAIRLTASRLNVLRP